MTQRDQYDGFERHDLGGGLAFFTGALPEHLLLRQAQFDALWEMHPDGHHVVNTPGGPKPTPRWQQAYGWDYHYTGRVNRALPVPAMLEGHLAWVREAVDTRANGLLLNWYEGAAHHIGRHHDSQKNLIDGSPIVTVSFGETRVFRLTLEVNKVVVATRDFPAADGAVFVLPADTNVVWKHGVPKSARYRGRRISVTFRAFAG